MSGLTYSNIWRVKYVTYSWSHTLDQDWQVWLNFRCIWLISKPLSFRMHCICHLLVPSSFINPAAASASRNIAKPKALFFNQMLNICICLFASSGFSEMLQDLHCDLKSTFAELDVTRIEKNNCSVEGIETFYQEPRRESETASLSASSSQYGVIQQRLTSAKSASLQPVNRQYC